MGKQYDLHVYSLLCAMLQHLGRLIDALFSLGCLPQSLSVSYDPSRSLSHERSSKPHSSWCRRVKLPKSRARGDRPTEMDLDRGPSRRPVVASAHRVDRRRGPSDEARVRGTNVGRARERRWIYSIAMSSVVDARTVMETTPARRHHLHHHRHRAAVGVTARARRWARPSVAVTARVDGNVEEGGA